MSRLRPTAALVALACLGAPAAEAHGPTGGQANLQLNQNVAVLVLTPWAASFPAVDDNHDGLLDPDEVRHHRAALLEGVDARVHLSNERGARPERIFADVLVGRDHHAGTAGGFLKLMLRYQWAQTPAAVDLRYDLWAGPNDAPLALTALRAPVDEEGRVHLDPDMAWQEGTLRPGAGPVRLLEQRPAAR